MPFEPTSLVLSAFAEKERLLLVRATDALRLCRDGGFEALPRHQAEARLGSGGWRDYARLRAFVQQARLTGQALARLSDVQVLRLVQDALRNAELAVVRACARAKPPEESAQLQQRRLVRAIETGARPGLEHEGRRYRLVADADLRRLPDRERFEVVGRDEATAVLAAVAARAEPSLAALLAQARDRLTRDWRPPLDPDGLVLLRRIRQVGSARPAAEHLRPPPRPSTESQAAAEPVEPSTFAADSDQVAQAATLIAAARDGVPFCEECTAG